jgi:hypothetical protein
MTALRRGIIQSIDTCHASLRTHGLVLGFLADSDNPNNGHPTVIIEIEQT